MSLIEKKSDISVLLSLDDEEVQKEVQDLLEPTETEYYIVHHNLGFSSFPKILSKNQSNLDSIALDIVIPPPKLIS
ncbi:MAG: hypothetical protein RLZZ231_1184 [Bacteroidota bacterium]